MSEISFEARNHCYFSWLFNQNCNYVLNFVLKLNLPPPCVIMLCFESRNWSFGRKILVIGRRLG